MKKDFKNSKIIFILLAFFLLLLPVNAKAYRVYPFIVFEETNCTLGLGVNMYYKTINENGLYYGGYLLCGKKCKCKGTLTPIADPYK